MNDTRAIANEALLPQVCRLPTDRYDVDAATARIDARELLDGWLKSGIIGNE